MSHRIDKRDECVKALAVIESRQTKETDMHEHTAATGTNHDHRTFDEFDMSKALRLPYTDDEMALIETATAQAIFDDKGLIDDETLTDMIYGYELDTAGNRRMQVKILDDKQDPVVTIDVTDIMTKEKPHRPSGLRGAASTSHDTGRTPHAASRHPYPRRHPRPTRTSRYIGGARRMSDHLPTMLVMLIIIAISWWSDTHQF